MRNSIHRFATTITCIVLSLFVSPAFSLALPFPVDVLESTYTTYVATQDYEFSDGSVTTHLLSRGIISPRPHGDALGSAPGAVAVAQADSFKVSVYTDTMGGPHEDGEAVAASAAATFEMSFVPVVDALASMRLDFAGSNQWYNSSGSVGLFDATLGQQVWTYGWECCNAHGTVPWDFSVSSSPMATTLILPTFLSSTHTYDFSMSARTHSHYGIERLSVSLSGLEARAVPESSSLFLLAVGLTGLEWWRRKRSAS